MHKKYQTVVGRNVPKAKISLFFFFQSSTIQDTPTRMTLHNTGGKEGRERQKKNNALKTTTAANTPEQKCILHQCKFMTVG